MKPQLSDLVSPSSVAPPGHRSRLLLATTTLAVTGAILHGSRTGDKCQTTQVVSADGEMDATVMERLAAAAGLLGRGLSYVVIYSSSSSGPRAVPG